MLVKSNIEGKQDLRQVNDTWFTNKTWMKNISSKLGIQGHDMYHVHFEKGSRTKLHVHTGDQVLIATKGHGSLELFENIKGHILGEKTAEIELVKGDVVFIPKHIAHTHGSTSKKSSFSHIAINITHRKGAKYKTTWYEIVDKKGTIQII